MDEENMVVDPNVARYVGLSLIIGFTVMLILDQSFLIMKENAINK
jgi:hypothetical protein